jgi:hypothetical protein
VSTPDSAAVAVWRPVLLRQKEVAVALRQVRCLLLLPRPAFRSSRKSACWAQLAPRNSNKKQPRLSYPLSNLAILSRRGVLLMVLHTHTNSA